MNKILLLISFFLLSLSYSSISVSASHEKKSEEITSASSNQDDLMKTDAKEVDNKKKTEDSDKPEVADEVTEKTKDKADDDADDKDKKESESQNAEEEEPDCD